MKRNDDAAVVMADVHTDQRRHEGWPNGAGGRERRDDNPAQAVGSGFSKEARKRTTGRECVSELTIYVMSSRKAVVAWQEWPHRFRFWPQRSRTIKVRQTRN